MNSFAVGIESFQPSFHPAMQGGAPPAPRSHADQVRDGGLEVP